MSDPANGDPDVLRGKLERVAREMAGSAHPFEGVSVELRRREGFQNEATTPRGLRVLLDEPVHFGGRGEAPDPAEYLLAAIGASLSVTLTAHAALRGLPIDAIRASLSAQIDARPFFDPAGGVGTPGLLDVEITLSVRTRAPRAAFRALLKDVLRATPVLRTLKRLPRVTVGYETDAG